jgi:hypothetical protein
LPDLRNTPKRLTAPASRRARRRFVSASMVATGSRRGRGIKVVMQP